MTGTSPLAASALFGIAGKAALVTGASGAFGSIAARTLAVAGCKVALASGNVDGLAEITEQCRQAGAEAVACPGRHSTAEQADALVDAAVAALGGLDILVVGSGFNKVAKIVDMEPSDFAQVMEANATGAWLIARAAGAKMLKQGRGGKIIFVSSARGLLGHPAGYTAYCASKAAIDGITRALGCEWGSDGITVNALGPTVFRSSLTAWMFEDDAKGKATREGMLARIPAGRLGEPEDLAGPLLFLASPASDFYTGHVLYADGGYTAG